MNILTKPFHEISFTDVVDCCKAGTIESAVLDYKQTMPSDLAKHFATFSNTHGGLIIIGVEEDSATGKPKTYEGLVFESKLIDQVNQFAANVSPFPRYEVRVTDEKAGKVFLLIKIFEGDQPPYMSNSDSTIRLRTGNISTPLRSPDHAELEKLYEKRNGAKESRESVLQESQALFRAAMERAERERAEAERTGSHPVSSKKVGLNAVPYRVTIMPISPAAVITDYRVIKDRLMDYRVQTRYHNDFPDLEIETMPGGIVFSKASWTNSVFEYGIVTEKGVIDSIEDIVARQDGRKEVWMGRMVGYLVRQLDVARKFYNMVGFNGLLACQISMDDVRGVTVHQPKPEGWDMWHEGTLLTKLESYQWDLPDLDTVKLNDIEKLSEDVLNTIEKFYWAFNMGTPNKEMLKDYLRQLGWQLPKNEAAQA